MTAQRVIPALFCVTVLTVAPAGAGSQPAPMALVHTAIVEPASSADAQAKQEKMADKKSDQKAEKKAEQKKEKKAEKKAEIADRTGLFWEDRPVLRVGKNFDLALKAKLQPEYIHSPIDLVPFGYPHSVDFHRARFALKGLIFQHIEFEAEREFATKAGTWQNVYELQGGKFKIPFGYEWLISSDELDFVYRTRATDSLGAGRDIGVMLHGRLYKKSVSYAVGYFQHDGSKSPTYEPPPALPDDTAPTQKGAFAARVTVSPLKLGKLPARLNNLEFGLAMVSSNVTGGGQNNLHGHMLFSGNFFHRDFATNGRRLRLGADLSWAPNAFSFSAEYMRTSEQRLGQGVGNETTLNNDLPDIIGTGWYVAGTWAITGEKKEGGLKPKRPLLQGGFGAVELAARYERTGFASGSATADNPASRSPRAVYVRPNGERVFTFGVNWYWNKWVKVQFNGMRESIDDPGRGPTPLLPASSWLTFVTQLQFAM
jgi:hypothetical protein